ncbi:DUF6122 family protein [Fontimonas sp. SYSU GA230001]|uniref:DUF6122 family protein n=1 Tax=Fontimonas sp. SYSU GA230001 TaxID=3142450 RepID=UPI0032B62094
MSAASVLHLVLHGLLPGAAAWWLFRTRWRSAWLIMMATMAVDLDHLLADPIYDPDRCSIGFHPLHTAPAIATYGVLTVMPATAVAGTGLLIHMALDASDCAVQKTAGSRT